MKQFDAIAATGADRAALDMVRVLHMSHRYSRLTVLFLLAVPLPGCMSSRMNTGLNNLLGQPVQAAVSRLGYPDGQREILGDRLYVWSTNHQALLPSANTVTTAGAVGGTPFYGTSTSFGLMRAQAYCTIQMAVTTDGAIKNYQWSGNPIGCRSYASELKR